MKRTTLLCLTVCLVALLLSGIATAQKLPEIKYEKYSLPNGLKVILHEDHTIPTVTINVWYHVGSKNEKRGKTGFAHIFEHMMFAGSEHFGDPTPLHESLGGDNNASTSEDRTNYFEMLPSNCLELGLWLESDRMGFLVPGVTKEKLANQIDVIQNERRQRIDNEPYAKSYELELSLLYPKEHPYSWPIIGSMEDIRNATVDDIKEFFQMYYSPSNASLCISGDFNPADARKYIEKYFAPIPAGPPISRLESWVPALDGVKRVVAEDAVTLPRLYIAWPTPAYYSPDDGEMDMLSAVLTSGKTSRLYKALVYDQQIAQDVSASQDSKELNGTFEIIVTAKPGRTLEELEKAVDAVIKEVQDKGVTPEELNRAQTDFESNFVRSLQQASHMADRLNQYNTYLGDPGKFQWDMERRTKVTVADVQRVARKYLPLDRRVIVGILPQGGLEPTGTEPDRTKQPALAQDPTFTPPRIQTETLPNGLTLMLVEKHDLPLVQVDLVFRNGWGADPIDKLGCASLTADMMDEGTKTRNALQISDDASAMGASFNTGAGYDNSYISLNILKKNLDKGLVLMTDVLKNPSFPEKELTRLREEYISNIQQSLDQPSTLAMRAFNRMMYGTSSTYSQSPDGLGTEASMKAMTRDDLTNFYHKYYSPKGATLNIVGDMTMAEAKVIFDKFFKDWNGAAVETITPASPKGLAATKIFIVDKPGAPQSMIVVGNVGISRNDPDYEACEVMNNTLGGQFTSRLNMNIREEKGYTYGVNSAFATRRGVCHFRCITPTQTEVTSKAITEILKEFRGITGEKPLTATELAASKAYISKNYPRAFETIDGLAGQLSMLTSYNLPLDNWTQYLTKVNASTVDKSLQVAKAHIHPNSLLIVVVGDREKIETSLKDLKIGEVTVLKPEDL